MLARQCYRHVRKFQEQEILLNVHPRAPYRPCLVYLKLIVLKNSVNAVHSGQNYDVEMQNFQRRIVRRVVACRDMALGVSWRVVKGEAQTTRLTTRVVRVP